MHELFKKYLRNQCSPKEVGFLLKQFEIGEKKELLRSLVIQQLDADEDLTVIKEKQQENILAKAYVNIKSQIFLNIKLRLLPLISVLCVGFLMT